MLVVRKIPAVAMEVELVVVHKVTVVAVVAEEVELVGHMVFVRMILVVVMEVEFVELVVLVQQLELDNVFHQVHKPL
ncbi:unnamed protein product [[Candida] boidinii]|nr:unnamed protein product [[Candida] boidinii]